MSSPVFRRHQRQLKQLGPRQRRADPHTRAAVFFGIHIRFGDLDQLVKRITRFEYDHRGHQLRDRSDGQDGIGILLVQGPTGFLVEHENNR